MRRPRAFGHANDAILTGRRSTPENAALVARACRLIEESEEEPSLNALAKAVGRSASYFHRSFKTVTGLTPKDYAAAHRASKVREGLASGSSVTEAIYDAGYNSSGRFYEKSTDMLGMTPTRFKAGGANEEIRFALGQTSLGAILVASSRKGVASILLGNDPDALLRQLQDRFPKANLIGADKDYEALVARVVGFIEAPRIGLDLPLDVRGTAFQRRVWQALQEIPVGQTVSYAEIARADRVSQGGTRCRWCLCSQQPCGGNPLSPSGPQRWSLCPDTPGVLSARKCCSTGKERRDAGNRRGAAPSLRAEGWCRAMSNVSVATVVRPGDGNAYFPMPAFQSAIPDLKRRIGVKISLLRFLL